MKTHDFVATSLLVVVLGAAATGCDAPPSGLFERRQTTNENRPNKTDDPTKDPSETPGGFAGGPKNTFDHAHDLGAYGGRDPFDILAQRQEEGVPEIRTKLHSCQKIPYATLKNILMRLGVDLESTGSPPTAGELFANGRNTLGAANYDARVGEAVVWSSAGAAKIFDIFVQAAPEIIENIGSVEECRVNGEGVEMFDGKNHCQADAIACLTGRPARVAQVQVCNQLVASASDVETGKRIAVATILSAAHTCE